MNPYDQAQRDAANARAAAYIAADPDAMKAIASGALGSQKVVLSLPYWSTVRFSTAKSGDNYVMTAGVRKAFAYKIGGNATIGGFASTFTPTECETNLTNENNTRNGDTFKIHGISAMIDPTASPKLVKHVWRNTALFLTIGGDNQLPAGRLDMCPSGGGLFGSSLDPFEIPGLQDTVVASGFMSNGNPTVQNYLPFPTPFVWNDASVGRDVLFNVLADLKTGKTFTIASRAAIADVATINGVAGTTQPADGDPGTYVDVTFRLWGERTAARSQNT